MVPRRLGRGAGDADPADEEEGCGKGGAPCGPHRTETQGLVLELGWRLCPSHREGGVGGPACLAPWAPGSVSPSPRGPGHSLGRRPSGSLRGCPAGAAAPPLRRALRLGSPRAATPPHHPGLHGDPPLAASPPARLSPMRRPPACRGRCGGAARVVRAVGEVLPLGVGGRGARGHGPVRCAGPHRHTEAAGGEQASLPAAIGLPGTGKAGFTLPTVARGDSLLEG